MPHLYNKRTWSGIGDTIEEDNDKEEEKHTTIRDSEQLFTCGLTLSIVKSGPTLNTSTAQLYCIPF